MPALDQLCQPVAVVPVEHVSPREVVSDLLTAAAGGRGDPAVSVAAPLAASRVRPPDARHWLAEGHWGRRRRPGATGVARWASVCCGGWPSASAAHWPAPRPQAPVPVGGG